MELEKIIKNISKNLRGLREEHDLTQEQLIQEIGEEYLSLRSYKSYEKGSLTKVPLLEKLILLADYYHVSLDYLVFNKPSTYDDSNTKGDCLKRLTNLIYTNVLFPVKEEDIKSQYYGKYLFLAYEPEVQVFMRSFEAICADHNYQFEYLNQNPFKGRKTWDKAFRNMKNLNDDWSPTKQRYDSLLIEAGYDPVKFFNEHMEKLEKHRLVNEIKRK